MVGGGEVTFRSSQIYDNYATFTVSFPPFEHPIAPIGCSLFVHCGCCSQGGGVFVGGGEVTFNDCGIYSNQATDVRARLLAL